MSKRLALCLVSLTALPVALFAQGGAPLADPRAADAATRQMSHHAHDSEVNPHLRLSTARPRTPQDSARGQALVATIRRELAKYHDVNVAIADGYEQFLPNVVLPVYHFTNKRYGLEAAFSFDASKPTSLLYRKNSDGTFALTGVMYTAPALLGEERLDRRIPLGLARWHQHINWCLPKQGEESRWRETRAGKPLFGPESPIASAEECAAVPGRFIPRLFGWMVHVNALSPMIPPLSGAINDSCPGAARHPAAGPPRRARQLCGAGDEGVRGARAVARCGEGRQGAAGQGIWRSAHGRSRSGGREDPIRDRLQYQGFYRDLSSATSPPSRCTTRSSPASSRSATSWSIGAG